MANSGLSINTTGVADAARQLDELADRLEQTFHEEEAGLTVVAPGRDEVSVRAATTMNEVRDSYAKSSQQGLNELREISAALRVHGTNTEVIDSDFRF
ncbi:PE family protein [Mycobacteroides sp. LB1]|uniref:PE family protein n=1 Tax=Mycobacteroides sp. LB1 TaxID=2750814 RepID=UPI0015E031F0|nr:PE family protein [Mycobacteroides sp. LB1]